MYLGNEEQTISIRERCLAALERLCVMLDLPYRIVVGSGCYQIGPDDVRIPRAIREIPIKDLEIHCPGYLNKMDGSAFLEVAGSAVLADILSSRFDVRCAEDGSFLWSGCTGIGMERMMFALLTNFGTNFEKYPAVFKDVFRSLSG